MTVNPKLITSIWFAAVLAWGLLWRVRRTFGRQPVHVARIWLRIGALTLLGGLVVATSVIHNMDMLGAVIAGVVGGGALAQVGLGHTRFEVTPAGRFYTPHTYTGLVVTALFGGRLLYRFLYLSSGTRPLVVINRVLAGSYQKNAPTLGILAALLAYYVLFYVGVLLRTRAPAVVMT